MNCTKCGAKADVFLCRKCGGELKHNLEQIPPLAQWLAEAHTKQTQTATPATTRVRAPRSEDEEESPVPFNESAFDTFDHLRTVCMRWVRDLCDTAGVEFWPLNAVPADFIGPLRPRRVLHTGKEARPRVVTPGQWRMREDYVPTTADLARWLYTNYLAIVNNPDAALCAIEIDAAVRTSYKMINPRRLAYCGPCPAVIRRPNDDETVCGTDIYAEWDDDTDRPALRAQCPRCKTIHDTAPLTERAFTQTILVTATELFGILDRLGEHLPRNRFYSWKKAELIRPRGWQHGGRITDHWIYQSDPPVFSLAEVRNLMKKHSDASDGAKVGLT